MTARPITFSRSAGRKRLWLETILTWPRLTASRSHAREVGDSRFLALVFLPADTWCGVRIDLIDEERRALLRVIEAAVKDPRYPLSPEVEALRRMSEKLRGADSGQRPTR